MKNGGIMKRTRRAWLWRLIGFLVVSGVAVGLVLAIQTGGRVGGGQAVAGADTLGPRQCMFVVAGRDATADGSVLMAYNNDYYGNNAVRVEGVPRKMHKRGDTFTLYGGQSIPQPRMTYKYTKLELHYLPTQAKNVFTEGGINEHQVGVLYGSWASAYTPQVAAADPPIASGLGDELWYLILERCKTAREGMDLVEQLLNTYGSSDWCIGTLAIGDPHEVWWIEQAGGHHWAAVRVPDDAYVVEANALQIREVNLADRDNFRGSPDLVQYAESLGIYNPQTDGPFDFAKVYGMTKTLTASGNANRIWGVQSVFTPSANTQPTDPYENRHVFLTPDSKITSADLMKVMRSHYEGTPLDTTSGYTLGNPHYTKSRPLCYRTTNYSAVWQLRDWLPDDIGGVMRVAMASPCGSVFVPFYAGISDTPREFHMGDGNYDTRSAFWVFRGIDNLVSGHYGQLISMVQQTWGAWESARLAEQPSVEQKALDYYHRSPQKAERFLTDYCLDTAHDAYEAGKALTGQLQTKTVSLSKQ